jgi:hypothetical protein
VFLHHTEILSKFAPYRARDHPATYAVMQRHQATIARFRQEGKAHPQDLDNLLILLDVYDTLNPRPGGTQERENWDALDPMAPLGQPVAKRFGQSDYVGYIVGYDYRWRSGGYVVVRYEDGDLFHFPKSELDAYRNYYALMMNSAPPPQPAPERVNFSQRAPERENALFACFNPVPDSFADTVLKAGGFNFLAHLYQEHRLFELRDNRLPTSVPPCATTCLIVNTVKMVLSLCLLFPEGSNERETLCQFVHFLPQLLHAQGLRHRDVESSSTIIAVEMATLGS